MKKFVDNEHIQKLLEKVPTNNLQLGLSKAYIDTNQFKEALATLNTIIQKDRNNREAYFERATAYFELGNLMNLYEILFIRKSNYLLLLRILIFLIFLCDYQREL